MEGIRSLGDGEAVVSRLMGVLGIELGLVRSAERQTQPSVIDTYIVGTQVLHRSSVSSSFHFSHL